ncbi:hypothetical protein LTR36_007196 [Oleoguttula mirabilis]|uniref:Antifreeze protein n=1 Tax=Oleoguttula mirabilis TaxID=1507867 RepID=A0AAV9JAG7_9PEZI|nr:hypothetical protein LTR36_007196 [Oleoguttula mirabilis]
MFYSKAFVCALGLGIFADAQITLGTASNYAIVAASTITNTGDTVIDAPIALSPGSSITGFPPGINTGEDIDNAAAVQAQADAQTAFTALAGQTVTTDLTGQDLGGMTLDAGVYGFSSSGGLTGALTLDGQGNSGAVFVFKFGSTLTTASASSVNLINGAQACNVYWQVGSSATLGTTTAFAGNVIAQASITVTTGTSLSGGGFYALTAAVTLDTNAIDPAGACNAAVVVTPTTTTAAAAAPTTTVTTTSTITNSASTTTLTVTETDVVTITQNVAAVVTATATSTTTLTSTQSITATAKATVCKRAAEAALEKRAKKTKTVTTTCAGHTATHTVDAAKSTKTVKATKTSTKVVWKTKSATTTHTSTKTPACTAKAKRDYQRMFG